MRSQQSVVLVWYGLPLVRLTFVDAMQAHNAVIGGEGNGGVIDPRVVLGRDSHIGIALIVELLAVTGQTLSELVATLPSCVMVKRKYRLIGRQLVSAARD